MGSEDATRETNEDRPLDLDAAAAAFAEAVKRGNVEDLSTIEGPVTIIMGEDSFTLETGEDAMYCEHWMTQYAEHGKRLTTELREARTRIDNPAAVAQLLFERDASRAEAEELREGLLTDAAIKRLRESARAEAGDSHPDAKPREIRKAKLFSAKEIGDYGLEIAGCVETGRDTLPAEIHAILVDRGLMPAEEKLTVERVANIADGTRQLHRKYRLLVEERDQVKAEAAELSETLAAAECLLLSESEGNSKKLSDILSECEVGRRHVEAASHLHDVADEATDVWMERAQQAEALAVRARGEEAHKWGQELAEIATTVLALRKAWNDLDCGQQDCAESTCGPVCQALCSLEGLVQPYTEEEEKEADHDAAKS